MDHDKKHRIMKWLWTAFLLVGLTDFVLRGPLDTLLDPIAASLPVLFAISVTANIISHWAAEEAADPDVGKEE